MGSIGAERELEEPEAYLCWRAIEHKRKAVDEPDDASIASKRIKRSHTTSPVPEKKQVNIVPFPERVSGYPLSPLCLIGW